MTDSKSAGPPQPFKAETCMRKVINLRILITFFLIVLFFGGGVFLDYTAAQRWITLSPDTESNKAIVEFAKNETANLTASAKLLYDFAKITLGVLLTLLSASSTVAKASQPPDEPTPEAAREKPSA